ncbi:hypothetical protein HDU98_005355 [Podochytrium sp. JEL0797]|nr:hypothetical protein HDU98_005355 [Podochytrium sp. JEL0797]
MDPALDRALWITAVTMCSISFLLNFLIIITNLAKIHKLTIASFLVYFMCVGGILVSLPVLILDSQNLAFNRIMVSDVACQIHAVFLVIGVGLSVVLCLGLTLLRYSMVVLKTEIHSLSFASQYTVGIFLFFLLLTTLPFMLNHADIYILRPSHVYCAINFADRSTAGLVVNSIYVLAMVAPTALIGFAYFSIYRVTTKMFDSKSEISSAVSMQCLAIVVTFMMGWTLMTFVIFYELIAGKLVHPYVDFAAACLIALYEIVNPIVVFIFYKDIRQNAVEAVLWAPQRKAQISE